MSLRPRFGLFRTPHRGIRPFADVRLTGDHGAAGAVLVLVLLVLLVALLLAN